MYIYSIHRTIVRIYMDIIWTLLYGPYMDIIPRDSYMIYICTKYIVQYIYYKAN